MVPTPNSTRSADRQADLILHNGTILTLDGDDSVHHALAITASTITALGDAALDPALRGPETEVIDLQGATAMPGINDSHLHGAWLGALWPNTVFGSPEPPTGHMEMQRLLDSEDDRRAAILHTARIASSLGITSYTEPGLGPGENAGPTGCFDEAVLDTYRALAGEKLLTARISVLMLYGLLDGESRLEDFRTGLATINRASENPRHLRIAGVKIFADGIPPMQNAWVHDCYADGSRGDLLIDAPTQAARAEALRRMITLAHNSRLQVGVHATGDRSIDAFIDAIAATENPRENRHYVIHGDLVTTAALGRLAELGMGINVQSGIATHTSQWLAGVLGSERAARAWPLEAALGAGIRLALSSDAPILPPDWREGIAAADRWMGPATDARARMGALLRCYTTTPAWQDRAEHYKGTLGPGMAADIVVLDANPYDLEPAQIPSLEIEHTIFDGRLVYSRADLDAKTVAG